jgi:ribosomal protein S18 acetylase RimI-like enzyme
VTQDARDIKMEIKFTSPEYVSSFWEAVDSVARERKYLLFLEAPPISTTKPFIQKIIDNNWTQFLAMDGDQVVGWCDILRQEREGTRHAGVLGMGVINTYRRKGIGEQLIKKAITDAFSKGIKRIELEVFASNTGAIALYQKLGFQIEGRKKNARFLDEIYDDIISMALLKKEAEQSS